MRQDILDYLTAHEGEFVSGQRISEALGISRTAVWKHIKVLKARGYVIESYTKKRILLTGSAGTDCAGKNQDAGANRVFRKTVHLLGKD